MISLIMKRLNMLGRPRVRQMLFQKVKKYVLNPEEILFMGDDIPYYETLKYVGVPTCPSDAVSEIKEICCYVSNLKGGEGCGRDVIEQVLKLNGKWMHNVE